MHLKYVTLLTVKTVKHTMSIQINLKHSSLIALGTMKKIKLKCTQYKDTVIKKGVP